MLHSIILRPLLVVAAILMLASSPVSVSANDYDKDTQQQLLDTNKATWEAYVGSPERGYTMKFTRSCFCMPDYRGPFDAVVKYDAVVNATYSADSDNDLPGTPVDKDIWNNAISTVLGAFDTIQRSLDEEAFGLTVKYDRDTGYPASVYIDWEEMIADEETSFSINNVVLSDDTAIITDAPSTASPSKTPSASPVMSPSKAPSASPVTIALIPVGGDKALLAPAPITSDQSASPITSESMSKTTSGPSKAPTAVEAPVPILCDSPSQEDDMNGSIRLTTTTTVLLSLAFLVMNAMT